MSQPALSKQIGQLERDLGFRLLSRDRRGVELTAAGAALLGPAADLLRGWDDAMAAARAAAGADTRVLRVGFLTGLGRGLWPRIAKTFQRDHPDWRVALRLHEWTDPSAGLLDGSSDVAFVWLPINDVDVDCAVVVTEPRWVALPACHPLAARDHVRFEELVDEPFVALPAEAGPLRDFWLAADQRPAGQPARIAAEVNNADEAFETITSGAGVALVAAGNADIYDRPGIHCRPVTGLSPAQLAVAWRRNDHRPVVRRFVDAAVAASSAVTAATGQPTP